MSKKIPDKIYETRCKWCEFRQGDENTSVPDSMILAPSHHDELPCSIFSIARWDDSECFSFHPNYIYGICLTCEHRNTFCQEDCDIGVTDKEIVFRPNDKYYSVASMTCGRYMPNPYWMDTMRKQAAEGKVPRNFDPETFKPVGKIETVSEKWKAEEAKLKAAEPVKVSAHKAIDADLTFFDILEGDSGTA